MCYQNFDAASLNINLNTGWPENGLSKIKIRLSYPILNNKGLHIVLRVFSSYDCDLGLRKKTEEHTLKYSN